MWAVLTSCPFYGFICVKYNTQWLRLEEEVRIMPRRKTHEEYEQQVVEKAPHIKVRGRYQGSRVKIKHYCTVHNVEWDVSPFNFLQHPNGCKECQNEVLEKYYNTIRKSDAQFRAEVEILGTGILPIEEYKGTHEKILFTCKEGHVWLSTPHDILDGYGCPFCAGNAVLKGYNDIWTTNPEMAKMLKNPDIGYEISRGSHREVEWVCPTCGLSKISTPKQVLIYGLACSRCSDGISYPNRLIVALLDQLKITVFHPEWSPEWIGKCRYDVYFIHNGKEYVVEMDGGLGHGGIDIVTQGQDTQGIQRDIFKDEQASIHNIEVIRIDCRYERKDIHNRFKYIKESILNSKLNQIFNLDIVDWEQCNKEATKSLHMIAAQQYDSGKGIGDISKELRVHYSTVYNWLKRMSQEGLCSYQPILGYNSHQKNRKKLQTRDA